MDAQRNGGALYAFVVAPGAFAEASLAAFAHLRGEFATVRPTAAVLADDYSGM